MRDDYCFRSNEIHDSIVNKATLGLTDDQKAILFDLRTASRSNLEDCRESLDNNNWNPSAAYTSLRIAGRLDRVSV